MPETKNTSSLVTFVETHPLPVVVSVAVGAFLLGGGAASWILFNGYIPNQLHSLQTQLNLCRQQTHAPALTTDEWPPLTQDQITAWATALRPFNVRVITVFWSQEVEAKRFFRSLQEVGRLLNCEVKAGAGQADGNVIEIQTPKSEPVGPVILNLFISVNWPASLEDIGDRGKISIFIPQKSR